MEGFSPLDRFLLLATVGGMFASLAFYAAQRTARFWKEPFVRFTRSSRAVQTLVLVFLIAVTAIGGNKGGTNDPPLRAGGGLLRTIPPENLPAWFVERGYPATDADASGIPDCWERWTHTSGTSPDADPDGDGLTNLAEFEAQTDPIRADTDGDGIDDATELAGLAAGVADLDPVVPATFAANEPDADGDGIPDIWEDSCPWTYEGVDGNGFPLWFDFPPAAEDNYDVRAIVSSSRHALLSWGGDEGESILLPPCTNLALRLRFSAGGVRTLALAPSPNASTNPVGTWRAAVVADWDERRGLPTEGDRVAVADGTMVDRSEHESVSVEAWTPQPALRSGGPTRGRRRGSPEITFTPRRIALETDRTFCLFHGPAPVVRVVASNAAPPYVWTEGGVDTVSEYSSYSPTRSFDGASYEVSCRWQDAHTSLLVSDTIRFGPIRCRPGQTNFLGAGWSSTHNPTNAADHAPGIVEVDRTFGPLCPAAHDVDARLGWIHDPYVLSIRNLVFLSSLSGLDETDHCFGTVWRLNGTIDLQSFLDPCCIPYLDKLEIRIVSSGTTETGSVFRFSSKPPDELYPDIYHVELVLKETSQVLDSFWLTVNSLVTLRRFEMWVRENESDLSWVSELPLPPAEILLDQSGQGMLPSFPERDFWNTPTACNSFLHHDASYEMRSCATPGGHGNQACFDGAGQIILSGIAAGTADRAHASILNVNSHVDQDVIPFLWALQLDGNPGIPTLMNNIRRPCLFLGPAIRSYIRCRPIIHPAPSQP